MGAHPKEQYYILPSRVVNLGAFVLFLSILLNALGTTFYAALLNTASTPFFFADDTPSRAPVDPRVVALEVVDSERYGMHDDNDWASVTPLGHGFVKVGEGADDFYAISMYHQLHCLNGFRKLLGGAERNASRAAHDAEHAAHCLAYMRQMVLCAADTTLEPAFFARNTDGRKTQAAYGTGVTHKCRDWTQVRAYAEANYDEWKGEAQGFAASEASVVLS